MATTTTNVMKLVLLFAITIVMVIALSASTIMSFQNRNAEADNTKDVARDEDNKYLQLPSKRVSRFLAANYDYDQNRKIMRGPADHCHKDNELCYLANGRNSTCCGNKCLDLSEDKANCGACHHKCKYTDSCCGGRCVNMAYDKRHCGSCNNKCSPGQFCVYGMCDYA